MQQQDLNQAETFWKEYLSSLEGPTRLSFKDIIEANPEKDYDTYSVAFSVEETEEMKKFASQYNLTLNTLIQGIVGTVLRTYTQQEDIVMGVTVSGRNMDLPGIEEMVGLFINTLPLRMVYNPEESYLSFFKNLQDQIQKLNEYTYTSLAQIQSWARLDKGLFDVLFVFENYPLDESSQGSVGDFSIKSVKGIEKTEYPLTVVVGPRQQLHFNFCYQTSHFNEEIIKRFSNHIRQLIQNILQLSEASLFSPIGSIPLLTQQEQHQILIEWNDTKTSYPFDKTIHQLFEEQVDRTPNNIALVYEDQELSYQHLNERSNQLAHYLRSLGVGPDTLVAIAVERSLEMVLKNVSSLCWRIQKLLF